MGNRKQSIVFIVTSYWAFGELKIALQFADQVSSEYEVIFLASRKFKDYIDKVGYKTYLLYFKLPSINRAILKDIEYNYDPAVIILADYLNYKYSYEHYGLTMDDLNIFSGIIGAFDLYNLSEEERYMDTYGFKNKLIEYDDEIMEFAILPCPILNVDVGDEKNRRFATALLEPQDIRREEEKRIAREKLGISSSEKVIVTTYAQWQNTYKKYKKATQFIEAAENKFQELLNRLQEDCRVICIGKEKKDTNSNVAYFNTMEPSIFEEYIMASDVFLTRNAISTSFANLIIKGVKGVLLINSEDKNMNYKCKMYPVGWYDFLTSIEKNNSYFDLFQHGEMLDTQATYETIMHTIDEQLDMDKLQKYNHSLSTLIKPNEIINHLLSDR